uniref:WD repeat, SAM and U-box domain-containing protein 1 n=1 Tax=Hirondellea gigas TaxID=1518452 RepID=A0A6A7FQW5_9CRUS
MNPHLGGDDPMGVGGRSAAGMVAGSAGRDDRMVPVATLTGHANDVTSVDITGRSLLATGSSDKSVRLYKWNIGDQFVEVRHSPLLGHTYAINSVTFSPFGTKLASAGTDGITIIWDVKSGERVCSLQPSIDAAALRVCTFSPNSSFLATGGDDDMVAIWDVSTLALLRQVGGHEASIASVCFTPDSAYLASGCSGGDLKLWDARYGHALSLTTREDAHDLGVSTLHFSPAIGKEDTQQLRSQYLLATGGQDTDLNLWSVEVGHRCSSSPGSRTDGASINLHHTFCGHKAPIMAVRFSPNGFLLASASGDKTVRMWDPFRMQLLCVLDGHKRYVTSCAFSDDSCLLVAGSGDRTASVWRVDNISALTKHSPSVHSLAANNKFPPFNFRENKKVQEWTREDVCSWLTEHGLAEYSHNFRAHAIDGRELITLTEDKLENTLGVDALGHRNKILRLVKRHKRENSVAESNEVPPSEFLCPITQELIVDPVICADGFTYERLAMEAWLSSKKRTSPMTNELLAHTILTPNRTLRTLIQRYREQNM